MGWSCLKNARPAPSKDRRTRLTLHWPLCERGFKEAIQEQPEEVAHYWSATSTTSSGLTLLLTVWPYRVTHFTKLLSSSKQTEETHSKTRDRPRPAPLPPPHQTLLFPVDTARGPVSPASFWSATSVTAVDENVDKLHKSSFAKPSHDY